MAYGVREYADKLGVSRAAAYKRVRSGRIGAYRAGSQWVVPPEAIGLPLPSSRPLSPENAIRFLVSLSGLEAEVPDAVARRRIAEKIARVRDGSVDARLLWSWVRARSPRLALSASAADLPDLLQDARLARSGLSDPRAGIAASGVVEGYVSPAVADALAREYLLVESDRPNVWLHVADIPREESGAVPIGFVIADLLDHAGPREIGQAAHLLAEFSR
ncbi:helix-turn-helix domain-containing protein [Agromyces sp. CFH 90414]|uniref:Helix-turn-helix domain-containing protein n=1 Tax=Agromyces agglutinans TaxID=2662258 RepID=A0A6I2FDH5_9MICO|nr:helix-turn-helix domain-containing protein [Agromyces agglutinans]MRG59973.1 helix-turn-helix domain-containing protein [Agromyces agglutinans]